MGIESTPSQVPNITEAMAEIGMIEQQAQGMGANDYEPSAFKRIREQLAAGEILPIDAITQAQGILASKQDYH